MDDDDIKLLVRGLPTVTDFRNFPEVNGLIMTSFGFAISIDRGFDFITSPYSKERFFIYRREPKEDNLFVYLRELGFSESKIILF